MNHSVYDISILVQGAIDKTHTAQCLSALRKIFLDAELILSTWEGSDLTGLCYHKVVFSPDPGAVVVDEVAGTLNNVNRQLVTTKAGLKVATRPYILKTRTDLLFHDASFLAYFGKYDASPTPFVKNRLLICNYFTRNPRAFSTCFHPSDWILFGRAEDVRNYYESPLQAEEESLWFKSHDKQSTFFTNYISRFTPEQLIFLAFLKRYQPVACNCYYHHHTQQLVEQTERTFAQCFVVLDYGKQLHITFPKYNPNRYWEKHTLLHHWQWKTLYRRYCENRTDIGWWVHLAYMASLRGLSALRVFLVRIMDYLGIKEKIKVLLATHFET